MTYTVTGFTEYENNFGMFFEELAKSVDVENEEQAEIMAEKLYNEGGYSSIYISYLHPETSCYYNPNVGHEPVGKNWISHFE